MDLSLCQEKIWLGVTPQLRTEYPYMTSVTRWFSPKASPLPTVPALACRNGARARRVRREGLS